MKMLARVGFLCFTLWLVGCRGPRIPHEGEFKLVDAAATPETLRLYGHLLDLTGKRVLFGHQDTLRYGHDWYGESNRSDIHDVVGEHPAIMGDDLSRLFDVHETPDVSFRTFVRYGQEATQLGMVRTFSWHMRNPVTNGESSDLTGGIASILPGGAHYAEYLGHLDRIAELFRALGPEPILFRPFHEHTGDWFWWSEGVATDEEYRALWRLTVKYLRDYRQVHNVLWVYSATEPSETEFGKEFEEHFLWGYPGDEYVDVLGLDMYSKPWRSQRSFTRKDRALWRARLHDLGALGGKRGKLVALTETGHENIPDDDWWTDFLLPGLNADPDTRRISYLMVWRNANVRVEKREHYFAPFRGEKSSRDFVSFRGSDRIVFLDEFRKLYSE